MTDKPVRFGVVGTGGSVGYKATLVNGQLSLLDGELTGNRAGTVIRHGQ